MLARSATRILRLATTAWLLSACSDGPQPIAYGRDACDYCRMQISDPRYGAELVTTTGKVHTFDSIECLAAFYVQARTDGGERGVWVSDVARPGTLIPAGDAWFARRAGPGSPMGLGLAAYSADADTASLRASNGSAPLRWRDVLAIVEQEGLQQGVPDARRRAAGAHGH